MNSKRLFDFSLVLILLIVILPMMLLIAIGIKLTSFGSIIFIQKRIGKNSKEFFLLKFRTMYLGAQKDLKKYLKLNESDGPAFKIRNDPRYVGIGKFLAHTGLDELPQLFNILKGEMSFVGPRPLPVYEAKKLKPWQRAREKVLPGITSSWVISGMHKLSFNEWIKLDLEYIKKKSFFLDIKIISKTVILMFKFLFSCLKELLAL